MKTFIYYIFHGTMIIEKTSQGYINEKSNIDDDLWISRGD